MHYGTIHNRQSVSVLHWALQWLWFRTCPYDEQRVCWCKGLIRYSRNRDRWFVKQAISKRKTQSYTTDRGIFNPLVHHFHKVGTERFEADDERLCNEGKERRNQQLRTILDEASNLRIHRSTEGTDIALLQTHMGFEGDGSLFGCGKRQGFDVH